MLNNTTAQYHIDAQRLYALVDLMGQEDAASYESFLQQMARKVGDIEIEVRTLASANDAILREAQNATRFKQNLFKTNMENDDPLARLKHSVGNGNFIRIIYDVTLCTLEAFKALRLAATQMRPNPIQIPQESRVKDFPRTLEEIQTFNYLSQMHLPAIEKFIDGAMTLERVPNMVVELGKAVTEILGAYHAQLLARHSTQGIKIHGDPIRTDVAMTIFENVDASGEIQDGTAPDEVSAYSVRKARVIADTVQVGLVGRFIKDPAALTTFIETNLNMLWGLSTSLAKQAQGTVDKIREITSRTWDKPFIMQDTAFRQAVGCIRDLDVQGIQYKEKTGLMSPEERKRLEHRNDTLAAITQMMGQTTTDELVQFILNRKKELRDWEVEQNSFFVCQISTGNPFGGEAPGMLTVVPGNKPNVTLNDVIGSGFSEVRDFIGSIGDANLFHNLFVATSPSKRADKNNVLLVGPQGCGKTEILRALASDGKSLGIFAQASDFLTCWKGEAEKNPKRLFEAGIRLQRESGKPTYFLIDEIDTILNGDRGQAAFGGTNLATEFQVLMDGITTYPHLALWGATNHPERIPTPLIRRFAKVLVVGELNQAHRVELLKRFVGYLPLHPEFRDDAFDVSAKLLVGAVGDIMRKVADHIWRDKMSQFVNSRPEEAKRLVQVLTKGGTEEFDVSKFTDADRDAFKDQLRPFVAVTPADLAVSVAYHLDNVAIKQEIRTCVETYERSRKFLTGINAR